VTQGQDMTLARTPPPCPRNAHCVERLEQQSIVVALATRHYRRQRVAFSVAERVQLAGQPAPAAPECLLDLAFLGGGPPFLAPAAWG
jgi:hypothetical protein